MGINLNLPKLSKKAKWLILVAMVNIVIGVIIVILTVKRAEKKVEYRSKASEAVDRCLMTVDVLEDTPVPLSITPVPTNILVSPTEVLLGKPSLSKQRPSPFPY
jgi:hypothetical protein